MSNTTRVFSRCITAGEAVEMLEDCEPDAPMVFVCDIRSEASHN
jgi:hypothetical protein